MYVIEIVNIGMSFIKLALEKNQNTDDKPQQQICIFLSVTWWDVHLLNHFSIVVWTDFIGNLILHIFYLMKW